jgi:hypothetical protein
VFVQSYVQPVSHSGKVTFTEQTDNWTPLYCRLHNNITRQYHWMILRGGGGLVTRHPATCCGVGMQPIAYILVRHTHTQHSAGLHTIGHPFRTLRLKIQSLFSFFFRILRESMFTPTVQCTLLDELYSSRAGVHREKPT